MSRDELYELVWTHPMTHLAHRFGKSDVALGKLCKRLQIPVPSRGWWSKIRSKRGIKRRGLRRRPLPPPEPGTPDKIDLPSIGPDEVLDNPPQKRSPKAPPAINVKLVSFPAHRFVRLAHKQMSPTVGDSTVHTIMPTAPNVRVTPGLVARAMLFADLLLRCAEAKGHEALIGQGTRHVRLSVKGETFDFRIEELTTRVVRIPADKAMRAEQRAAKARGESWVLPHRREWPNYRSDDHRRPYDQTEQVYDGRLRVTVERVKYWMDRLKHRVEDDIPRIIETLETEAAARPVRRWQQEQQRLVWAEQQRQQDREEAEAKERQDRLDREMRGLRRRREYLLECAAAYRRAKELSDYLAFVQHLEDPKGDRGIDRLVRELRVLVAQHQTTAEKLESDIVEQGLFSDD